MAEQEIRSGREDGFTVLYNSMVKDDRLPLEAKGLFAYIMSRPPDWKFSVSGLAASTKTSKDKVRRILGQLEKVGYLIREQGHKENGTFGGNIYVLQDFAPPLSENTVNGENRQREKPLSENTVNGENRQREKPLSAFPTQPNKDNNPVKIILPPIVPREDGAFDAFWAAYPRRVDKQKARRAWAKLKPDAALLETVLRALELQAASGQWTRDNGAYIPYPASWLNGRRWEDELPGRSESDRSDGYSREVNGWEV